MHKILKSIYLGITLITVAGCSTTIQNKENLLPIQKKIDLKKSAYINAELGIEYLNKNMLDLAKNKLLKAKELDNNLPIVHYALALYFEKLKELKKAKTEYKKALLLDPQDFTAKRYYATFLCSHGQTVKAEVYFKSSIANLQNDKLGVTYADYGYCLLNHSRNYTKAKEFFKKAVEQNSNLFNVYYQLSDIFYLEKKYYKAKDMINKFNQIHQNTKQSLILEMNIARALDDYNTASSIALLLNSKYRK